jgi:hypothetical protein
MRPNRSDNQSPTIPSKIELRRDRLGALRTNRCNAIKSEPEPDSEDDILFDHKYVRTSPSE